MLAYRFNTEESVVTSWRLSPPTQYDLKFWIIGWILFEHRRPCAELLEREHLHDLIMLLAYQKDRVGEILAAIHLSEDGVVDLIVKRKRLSARQQRALKPFLREMDAENDAREQVERLAVPLNLASDIMTGLNGLTPLVVARFQEQYPEVLAALEALFEVKK